MARQYSAETKSTLASTDAAELPLYLLEITHDGLTTPVRVCNDTQDLVSNGDNYIGVPFEITMPDDFENQAPKATLSITNVGRDLMYWLESSNGAQGAQVRIMQVMRSVPDVIEWDVTMDLTNIGVSWETVSGQLGFENLFARPAIAMTYRPDTAPGVF